MSEPQDLIRQAKAAGAAALSEYDSKRLLASAGVPCAPEVLATSRQQALEAAAELGPKVALKACAASLMHKSDGGWLRLGLDAAEAGTAYDELTEQARAAGVKLQGVLVQKMVSGNRELLMGLSRDPQFGPCVMIGMGGVFAEVLADTAFRMAPFDAIEAAEMLSELKCKPLLGAFRGQQPADTEALIEALCGLSRLGAENPDITEIDVNPLIIQPDGRIVAVDGLVVLGE